jgi:hypothetical protein
MSEQPGRGNGTRPGLFQSGGEVLVTFLIWLVLAAVFAPAMGLWGHLMYLLLKLGWELI